MVSQLIQCVAVGGTGLGFGPQGVLFYISLPVGGPNVSSFHCTRRFLLHYRLRDGSDAASYLQRSHTLPVCIHQTANKCFRNAFSLFLNKRNSSPVWHMEYMQWGFCRGKGDFLTPPPPPTINN
ncbi:hypothetical protein FKM82_004428 [Ascaphus truei]